MKEIKSSTRRAVHICRDGEAEIDKNLAVATQPERALAEFPRGFDVFVSGMRVAPESTVHARRD